MVNDSSICFGIIREFDQPKKGGNIQNRHLKNDERIVNVGFGVRVLLQTTHIATMHHHHRRRRSPPPHHHHHRHHPHHHHHNIMSVAVVALLMSLF